ncbi:hypothetical protein [Arthrobacter sp. D1-17]
MIKGFRRRPAAAWLCGPLMVALGVAAHSAVGQPVPALSLLVALTALLSLAASVTARNGMPGWMLLLLAGLVQQVLHLAFSVFSLTRGGFGFTGHGHGTLIWQPQQPSEEPAGSAAPDHTLELLLYAHTAATLVAVLLIAKWDTGRPRGIMAAKTARNNDRT